MPFLPAVKSETVEAAAGHCCVCHRFDAGHIEVHHIQPQADGGSDDIENAIALCFDCHTWAGHYNIKHPKGFRYSPAFLRSARQTWYERVAAGPISSASEDVAVRARYLISRDQYISTRLLAGDLSVAPIKDSTLAENEFGKSISAALRLRPQGLSSYYGDSFKSIDDYLVAHPDAKRHLGDLDGYAYYDCIRGCSRAEFSKRVGEDKLSHHFLTQGVNVEELCVVAANTNQCGDESVSETYLTRPTWVVFLALTNDSNKPIAFDRIMGQRDTSKGFRSLGAQAHDFAMTMPSCEISSAQTALIPIALLMGPIEELGEEQVNVEEFRNAGDSLETMNLTEFPGKHLTKFRLYGPAFWPKQVFLRRAGVPVMHNVHPLTLDSVYTLDRVWLCGSCPHLFALDQNGNWRYIAELIPKGLRTEVLHSIDLPPDVIELVVAELEDEESMLSEISIDGDVVAHQMNMRKGDLLRLSVSRANTLCVKGAYFPFSTLVDDSHGPEFRNRIICQFLSRMNSQMPSKYLDLAVQSA
jgi:hypothetical protein